MSTSTERMRAKREKDRGLEAARARGRAYGEAEVARQGMRAEWPAARERVARAEAYAVWLYEGRPIAGLDLDPFKPGIVP